MGVPEEIRSVPRPRNTIVVDNQRDGPNRWGVRMRAGSVYDPVAKITRPRNGKTIGHIRDGAFVPLKDDGAQPSADLPEQEELFRIPEAVPEHPLPASSGSEPHSPAPPFARYGPAALAEKFSRDLLPDLRAVFPPDLARTLLVIAMLRVTEPGIPDSMLEFQYERSYLKVFFPGVSLAEETVRKTLMKIGMEDEARRGFYALRQKRMGSGHELAVDTLKKTGAGPAGSLLGYRPGLNDAEDRQINLLYAWDRSSLEPVCMEILPGDSADADALGRFVTDHNIRTALLMCTGDLPPDHIAHLRKAHPGLHFLAPLAGEDDRIPLRLGASFNGVLDRMDRIIYYSGQQMEDGTFLCLFKDLQRAQEEELAFAEQVRRNQRSRIEDYNRVSAGFGLTAFVSDTQLDPNEVYQIQEDRRYLKMLLNAFPPEPGPEDVRNRVDFGVIGSEFVSFIAAVIVSRILRYGTEHGIFAEASFGEILAYLREALRCTEAPEPMSGDEYWGGVPEEVFRILEKFDLCRPAAAALPAEKENRAGKEPEQRPATSTAPSGRGSGTAAGPEQQPVASVTSAERGNEADPEPEQRFATAIVPAEKEHGAGAEQDQPPAASAAPSERETGADMAQQQQPATDGDMETDPDEAEEEQKAVQPDPEKDSGSGAEEIHRPRGRPRKYPPRDPNEPRRPRGRPRIHPAPDPNQPKRPRGRPRKDRSNSQSGTS